MLSKAARATAQRGVGNDLDQPNRVPAARSADGAASEFVLPELKSAAQRGVRSVGRQRTRSTEARPRRLQRRWSRHERQYDLRFKRALHAKAWALRTIVRSTRPRTSDLRIWTQHGIARRTRAERLAKRGRSARSARSVPCSFRDVLGRTELRALSKNRVRRGARASPIEQPADRPRALRSRPVPLPRR